MEEKDPKAKKEETNEQDTARENTQEVDDKDLDQARGGLLRRTPYK